MTVLWLEKLDIGEALDIFVFAVPIAIIGLN
jgi:hypothetical protein